MKVSKGQGSFKTQVIDLGGPTSEERGLLRKLENGRGYIKKYYFLELNNLVFLTERAHEVHSTTGFYFLINSFFYCCFSDTGSHHVVLELSELTK